MYVTWNTAISMYMYQVIGNQIMMKFEGDTLTRIEKLSDKYVIHVHVYGFGSMQDK